MGQRGAVNLDDVCVTGPRGRFYTCNEAYFSFASLLHVLYQRLRRMSTIGLFYGAQSKKRAVRPVHRMEEPKRRTQRRPTSYLIVRASKSVKVVSVVVTDGGYAAKMGGTDLSSPVWFIIYVEVGSWVREDRSEGEFDCSNR